MDHLTTEQLQKMLLKVSEKIIISEPLLTELDTIIGDGDHGFGMRT
ncbi:MAG: dihydroxyacetone kinase subunit L, partial [Lachnospiraceae bacterium]|nr:dihydroxyacetone kinase subunit L [Lachnospiraceae bacterium]